ncbi:MAG: cytochrome c5 family protein [Alphaproteobacteria bacterium]|nr:MAG: cytochrome c5 family protein [Alphaproteobacteria bacterium]
MIKPAFGVLVFAAVSLAACDNATAPAEDRAALAMKAATMLPDDADLSAKYERSCIACHVTVDSGAPIVGEQAEWQKRFQAGEKTVLSNTISGIRAMPPRGSCLDCTADDLAGLITFLSGRTISAETVAAVAAEHSGEPE